MKNFLLIALLSGAVAAGAGAQPAAKYKLDAPIVSAQEAQKLALPDDIGIHLQNVTLRAALQELGRQSGLPFDLSGVATEKLGAKISIDIDTPSVMRALNAIADEAALKFVLRHAQSYDQWHVVTDKEREQAQYAPDSVDGMFAARLLKIDVSLFKQFEFNAQQPSRTQTDNLNLTLKLTPDPGWPISGLPVLRATRAEDDQGRSLLNPDAEAQKSEYDAGFRDAWSTESSVLRLLPPAADARAIAHLEGEALYMVATKRARWELPDLLAEKSPTHTFNIGEMPVVATISDAKIEDKTATFRIGFALPKPTLWQNFSGNTYSLYEVLKWMTVEDANGTKLVVSGSGGGSNAFDFYSYARFSHPSNRPGQKEKTDLKLPLKFVFTPPTEWVRASAKFKFDDVPLP